MKKFMSGAVGMGLMFGLILSFAWAEGGDPGKGKAIYERECVLCHGAHGKGDGPAGAMLSPHPADFTSPKTQAKSDKELTQAIQDGKVGTGMAAFKARLSEQQVLDVLSYLRTLGK